MTDLLETPVTEPDTESATGEFFGRTMQDATGCLAIFMAAIGDELGLFAALAAGPATAAELAERAGVTERFTLEWARAMTATGYLDYSDSDTSPVFEIPPARIPVLAVPESPIGLGGILSWVLAVVPRFDEIIASFRTGSGVPMSSYGESFARALDRFGAPVYATALVPVWIPAAGDLERRLHAGIDVADVGCGAGRALIELAKAYPQSRFSGFDASADQVSLARRAAAAAGLSDRVSFEVSDVRRGLPRSYDLITTFDVLHDSGDPQSLLRTIRSALRDGGSYLCMEPHSEPTFGENVNPLGAIFYAVSVLFCLQVAVADGGPGYGSLGLSHPVLTDLCRQSGFQNVDALPVEDPMNSVYLVTP